MLSVKGLMISMMRLGSWRSSLDMEHLFEVVTRQVDGYRDFKRLGKNGKTRSISIPDANLAKAQELILRALETRIHNKESSVISKSAHAYRKNHSTITAATVHANTKWAVKLDIKSFFDNVTETQVRQALSDLCGAKEASIVAKICTRLPFDYPAGLPRKYGSYRRRILDSIGKVAHELEPSLFVTSRFIDRPHPNSLTLPPKKLKRFDVYGGIYQHDPELENSKEKLVARAFARQSKMKEMRARKFKLLGARLFFALMPESRQKNYRVRPSQIRKRTREGYLPQGSATSGLLANLVMFEFDEALLKYCKSHSLRYTRYSDDLFISSDNPKFNRSKALQIISIVQQLCEANGFTLNKDKTKILTPGTRKQVLGLLVDGPSPRLPANEKERVNRALWLAANNNWETISTQREKHVLNETHFLLNKRVGSYENPDFPSTLFSSLRGWLCYLKVADPQFLRKLLADLERNKWKFIDPVCKAEITDLIRKLISDEASSEKAANRESRSNPNLVHRDVNDLF